ncbi:MAG: sensor histidine kinase [Mangrovibacterium sp.]
MLKFALLLSMLFQLGATVYAISLIRRTRYNVSWILISSGLVLMALRRLFDFSTLFWESKLFQQEEINSWIGVFISVLLFIGVIFIKKIFNLQDHIEQLRLDNEKKTLAAVIDAEDNARQAFARELHDGLGPVLSSIKMSLSAIDPDSIEQPNRRIIERSCLATDEAITSLKEISNLLSPHILQSYGLIKAIKATAKSLLEGTQIQFEVNSNINERRFRRSLEINVYRIVCELINNSVTHAAPRYIRIDITEEQPIILLTYKDDGSGFDLDKHFQESIATGMGLENIFSRIKLLNGQYQINTSPDSGFIITLKIPVE